MSSTSTHRIHCDHVEPDRGFGPHPCNVTLEIESSSQPLHEAMKQGWTFYKGMMYCVVHSPKKDTIQF